MTTLKPCPHCGAGIEIFHGIAADFECVGCGAVFKWTYGGIEEKIEKFNRRTLSPEIAEALREAKEVLGEYCDGCPARACKQMEKNCPPCPTRAALARIEAVK